MYFFFIVFLITKIYARRPLTNLDFRLKGLPPRRIPAPDPARHRRLAKGTGVAQRVVRQTGRTSAAGTGTDSSAQHPDNDRRATQIGRPGIPQGVRQRWGHLDRRQPVQRCGLPGPAA